MWLARRIPRLRSNEVTGLTGDGQDAVPYPALGVQFFPLRHRHGDGHVGTLVVPIAYHHLRLAGHARMYRILPQQQAESRIPGIGRKTPDGVARVDVLQLHLATGLPEMRFYPVPQEKSDVAVLDIAGGRW